MPTPRRSIPCRLIFLVVALPTLFDTAAAATFTVAHTGDSGANSLRWAIDQANAAAGADSIVFNLPGSGVRIIAPLSPLPTLSSAITLDATTQPGYAGVPLVALNGAGAGAGTVGLVLSGGSSTVRGLLIHRFDAAGIRLGGGSGHRIEHCVSGLDATGAVASNAFGIEIDNVSNTVVGPGNTFSGNRFDGVAIRNANASGNVVRGNRIGTNATGSAAVPNAGNGVAIVNGAHHNTIGGSTAADLNVISGNTLNGIGIASGAHDNTVARANIGLGTDGITVLANGQNGVLILQAPSNFVGGSVAGTFNAISGNGTNGVEIRGSAATGNIIRRSVIGTTLAGNAARANGGAGVRIDQAPGNLIGEGPIDGGPSNLISGNNGHGVEIVAGSHSTRLLSNRIGTDATGTVAIGNSRGVSIDASDSIVVGEAGRGNIVSGNRSDGIVAFDADDLRIEANRIGTNAAGTAALGNRDGIFLIAGTAPSCGGLQIGGLWGATGNLISGNDGAGLRVGAGCDGTVAGNRIGTNLAGTAALANASAGIVGIQSTLIIGGNDHAAWTCDRACNLVSGNDGGGIELPLAQGSHVLGNFVGVRADGQAALPNRFAPGVSLSGIGTIGGAASGAGNLVSGNAATGISVSSDAAGNIAVFGNRVGTNAAGSVALPNTGHGIFAGGGARVAIGSTDHDPGACNRACNLIAANDGIGVVIDDDNFNVTYPMLGNFVGVNNAGVCLGNGGGGIRLIDVGSGRRVGGIAAGEANRIRCNRGPGVAIAGSAARVGVRGNSIASNHDAQALDDVLGIDLVTAGPAVTENDDNDTDVGPNLLQNTPMLGDAMVDGATLHVAGTINTRPGRNYAIDVYASPACDDSNYGEGQTYLGSIAATTDAAGNASFDADIAAAVAVGSAITATATALDSGSTSEFSRCIPSYEVPRGQFSFETQNYMTNEGAASLTVTVHRANGSAGAVGVSYATEPGSASAGGDYTATSGVLSFADGVTSRSFSVPIANDAVHELQEDFGLRLSNPTGGATLGIWSQSMVFIEDDDMPTLRIDGDGCSVTEGDSGNSHCAFVARLSAVAVADVTFDTSAMDNGSASASDYVGHASVPRSIPAGSLSATIDVPVIGDGLDENDETFDFRLSGVSGAILSEATATGTIVDDDAIPDIAIASCGNVAEGNADGAVCMFTIQLSEASGRDLALDYWTEPGENLVGPADAHSFEAPTVPHIALTYDTDATFSGWHVQRGPVQVVGNGFEQAHRNQSLAFTDATDTEPALREVRRTLDTAGGARYRLSLAVSGQNTAPRIKEADVLWEGETLARIAYDATGNTPSDMAWEYHSFDVTAAQPGSLLQLVGLIPAGLLNSAMLIDDVTLTPAGSASSGIDYRPASSNDDARLSIPAGFTSATVAVMVLGDTEFEGDEVVRLRACNDEGACGAATATIRDDDILPGLSIGHASSIEGDGGTTPMLFDVHLQPASAQTVTVHWSTANGSAIAGSGGDYIAASGVLSFAPGQTTQPVAVQVRGDTTVEDDETLHLDLSAAQNADIAIAQGTGTILDDDLAEPQYGRIEMLLPQVQVGERAGSVRIEFRRIGGSDGAASVQIRTGDGDAMPGVHYGAIDGFSIWADGHDGTTGFDIPIHDDGVAGPDREFFLILSEPAGAVLGSPDRTRIVIRDGEVFVFADGFE